MWGLHLVLHTKGAPLAARLASVIALLAAYSARHKLLRNWRRLAICTGVIDSPCTADTTCPSDVSCAASRNTAGTCLITGLTASTSYSFTVRARNPQGLSAASTALTVTTLATSTLPDTMTAPTLMWYTATSLQVNVAQSGGLNGAPLNHGATPITGYRVEVLSGTTVVSTVGCG